MNLSGKLLVASPIVCEKTFSRSVILLVEHSSDGAAGVIINRPLPVEVSSVLPQWDTHVTSPGHLFSGGPVGQDSALGIVAVPGGEEEPVGVRRFYGSLAVLDLDAPPEIVVYSASGMRIFAGYSGWDPGQLESEVREGAWFVVDAEPHDAFSDHPETLWSNVLRRQRNHLAFMATFPPDPSLN